MHLIKKKLRRCTATPNQLDEMYERTSAEKHHNEGWESNGLVTINCPSSRNPREKKALYNFQSKETFHCSMRNLSRAAADVNLRQCFAREEEAWRSISIM